MPEQEEESNDIPPFPIEELLSSLDREAIKKCAEEIVTSSGEQPVYRTRTQLDTETRDELAALSGDFIDPVSSVPSAPSGAFGSAPGTSTAQTRAPEPVREEMFLAGATAERSKHRGPVAPDGGIGENNIAILAAAAEIKRGTKAREDEKKEKAVVGDVPPPVAEAPHPALPDRRLSLLLFGTVLIVLSIGTALLMPVAYLGQQAAADAGGGTMVLSRLATPLVLMGFVAAVFLVLGFGAIFVRRWARALTQVWSWLWMVVGVFVMVVTGVFFEEIASSLPGVDGLDGAQRLTVSIAVLAAVFVFIPGILILYFSLPSVKATCEAHDPKVRWTDRCHQAILVLAGILAILGGLYIAAGTGGRGFSVVDRVLGGQAAMLAWTGAGALFFVLAIVNCFHRKWVWWTTLAVVLAAAFAFCGGYWIPQLQGGDPGKDVASIFETLDFSPPVPGKIAITASGCWAALILFVVSIGRLYGTVPRGGAVAAPGVGAGASAPQPQDVAAAPMTSLIAQGPETDDGELAGGEVPPSIASFVDRDVMHSLGDGRAAPLAPSFVEEVVTAEGEMKPPGEEGERKRADDSGSPSSSEAPLGGA